MGGKGSGRFGERPGRRRRVEECLLLDGFALHRVGILQAGKVLQCRCRWPREGISATLTADGREPASLAVVWPVGSLEKRQTVALAVRRRGCASLWHFLCPCGRSVAKLYAPPGANRWACRRCHNLAYASQATRPA